MPMPIRINQAIERHRALPHRGNWTESSIHPDGLPSLRNYARNAAGFSLPSESNMRFEELKKYLLMEGIPRQQLNDCLDKSALQALARKVTLQVCV